MNNKADLDNLARFLDSKYQLPGGIRIGWDGILGFIPGVGDLITNMLSMYIIVRAAALGCSPAVILRMGGNVLLDNIFDLVPVLGNFFDIFWKSNLKNIALIERYQANPARTDASSKFLVGLTVICVFAVLISSVIAVGYVAVMLFEYIRAVTTATATI